jgi:hypothetical protein
MPGPLAVMNIVLRYFSSKVGQETPENVIRTIKAIRIGCRM